MIRAMGIGDNVCDKYLHLNKMFPGGQALNFAVYSKMLGCESAYLGAFGKDAVGGHVQKVLQELAVDNSRSRSYEGENGYAVIDLQDGDRVFVRSNKGGVLREHPLMLTEEDLSYIAQFDIVHTSNNSYINDELPKLAELPVLVSYDFSCTWKDEAQAKKICKSIDFGFLSCSELNDDEVMKQTEKMYGWGCKIVVATTGAHGGSLYDGNKHYSFQPKLVQALDTLGAGDSMAAGFLVSYIQNIKGKNIEKGTSKYQKLINEALNAGAEFAAKTCLVYGAFGHGTKLIE